MLEQIMDRRNVEKALVSVIRNGGAGGVDGMQTDELRDYLNTHYPTLRRSILGGTYQPSPVRKVEIPKAGGGLRMLGIPTVLDRLLQQAISQWLNQHYEPIFSPYSYGFRPKRNAHQAVVEARRLLNEGKTWIVELDLEKFFDRVNHDKLMSLLALKVEDKATLRLIRQYLRSGILESGVVSQRIEGTPQGSPIALRTHSQTLTMLNGLLLKEEDFSFGYFIKSIIFMKNEKITEFGISRENQSGACLVGATETAYTYYRAVNGDVWCISNTGLSLCSTGQREQRADCHSGEFSGFYSKTATQSDWSCKGICGLTGNFDQQSSQGGVGRVFSKKTPWPKRRGSLKYRSPMTASGGKSSHRFTISLSQGSQALFSQNILSIITL